MTALKHKAAPVRLTGDGSVSTVGGTTRRHRPGYYKPAPIATMPSLTAFARALPNGKISPDGIHVYFTVPGRKKRDRSCWLKIKDRGKDVGCDFIVDDFHRDGGRTWPEIKALKDFVRAMVGIEWKSPRRNPDAIKRGQAKQNAKRRDDRARRRKTPLRMLKPWLAAGESRATWYRHGGRAEAVRQNPPAPIQVSTEVALVVKQRGSHNGYDGCWVSSSASCVRGNSPVRRRGQRRRTGFDRDRVHWEGRSGELGRGSNGRVLSEVEKAAWAAATGVEVAQSARAETASPDP